MAELCFKIDSYLFGNQLFKSNLELELVGFSSLMSTSSKHGLKNSHHFTRHPKYHSPWLKPKQIYYWYQANTIRSRPDIWLGVYPIIRACWNPVEPKMVGPSYIYIYICLHIHIPSLHWCGLILSYYYSIIVNLQLWEFECPAESGALRYGRQLIRSHMKIQTRLDIPSTGPFKLDAGWFFFPPRLIALVLLLAQSASMLQSKLSGL